MTRLEFLLGKQLPYIGLGMINFLTLVLLAVFVFDIPVKGNLLALCLGALLYVTCATGLGLLMSSILRSQIAGDLRHRHRHPAAGHPVLRADPPGGRAGRRGRLSASSTRPASSW